MKEIRVLYILIIALTIMEIIRLTSDVSMSKKEAFSSGVEKGKLIKMEEFREIYFPATN